MLAVIVSQIHAVFFSPVTFLAEQSTGVVVFSVDEIVLQSKDVARRCSSQVDTRRLHGFVICVEPSPSIPITLNTWISCLRLCHELFCHNQYFLPQLTWRSTPSQVHAGRQHGRSRNVFVPVRSWHKCLSSQRCHVPLITQSPGLSGFSHLLNRI